MDESTFSHEAFESAVKFYVVHIFNLIESKNTKVLKMFEENAKV
jgi:hypothetical protein